jgi:hypothetical protein
MIWGRLEDWDDGDRNSERATRHAEKALLRGDAGWKSSRVDHRRIGRRRLPADQLVQVARSNPHQIRADHDAFSEFRSAFLDHESKEFWVTFSML